MPRRAVRLIIEGRVQGVGYRWWAMGEAQRLDLDGWVRNLADGRVELLAIGAADAIDALVRSCRQGPLGATVSAVAQAAAEDDGSRGFAQKPTA